MIYFASISTWGVDTGYLASVVQLFSSSLRVEYGLHHAVIGGSYPHQNKNMAVALALDTPDCEWLIFSDTDTVFQPFDIETLVESANRKSNTIVSALATSNFRETRPVQPVAWYDDEMTKPLDTKFYGMVRAAIVGGELLLVHRRVLEVMSEAYGVVFDTDHDDNYALVGEDVNFCRRARKLGFDVWVNTACRIGHRKASILYP